MNHHTTSWRTHNCGELRLIDQKKQVKICGWVQKIRDKGHLIWMDIRDRYGITQVCIEKEKNPTLVQEIRVITLESVVQITGKVVERIAKNPNIPTGDIEIIPHAIHVINKAKELPFTLQHTDTDVREELRMQYRYLDLRRSQLQQNLLLRHQVTQEIRTFLTSENFVEIETPILIKSTPEGARDFIVPSRIHPNQYYALPQSPQLLKQTLMIGGLDRYYQIAKCFRDEDLRADRQPEFTQIDIEASYVRAKDIMDICEKMVQNLWKNILGIELPTFACMTYQEAMTFYGSDKPDLRWNMPFVNITEKAQKGCFENVTNVLAICVHNGTQYSRKILDTIQNYFKEHYADLGHLVYVKYDITGEIKSSVDKFYTKEELKHWLIQTNASLGDLLLILGSKAKTIQKTFADIRNEFIKIATIAPIKKYAPLWVIDFPLFEYIDGKLQAMHHPFTSPRKQDEHLLNTDPTNVIAQAYDLVINGQEIGSGSIRMHERLLQEKILSLVGLDKKSMEDRFGFLLNALDYGAPPHGGIALGLARLCMILGSSKAIRDYIAFPKNNQGRDTMMNAPSFIE